MHLLLLTIKIFLYLHYSQELFGAASNVEFPGQDELLNTLAEQTTRQLYQRGQLVHQLTVQSFVRGLGLLQLLFILILLGSFFVLFEFLDCYCVVHQFI